MIGVVAFMFPIHFVNRIRRKARPKVTKKHETAIIMKLETSRKVLQVELRGHYNRQTIGRNYTISGSKDNQCEADGEESLFPTPWSLLVCTCKKFMMLTKDSESFCESSLSFPATWLILVNSSRLSRKKFDVLSSF